MIRLIASDIDGTLLPYDETVMPQRLFPLIRRLRERNILFCPASGRQYHSMRTLFAPVADEMCFLCENGAVLYGPGTEEGAPLLSKTLLPRQEALALSRAIMDIPGCDVIIEGQNLNYLCGCGPELVHEMAVNHGNLVTMVDRPEDVPEEIVKIARKIGTFDTSILPYEDCCTVFTPRHPKTKPSVEETREYEAALDVEGLCQRAMANREMIRVKPQY